MADLYVCIKSIPGLWRQGAVACFDVEPDTDNWRTLRMHTATDSAEPHVYVESPGEVLPELKEN